VGIGAMNSYLAEQFWTISTSHDWKNLAGHGGVFFILLIFAHMPMVLVELFAGPGFFYLMMILSLIVNSFIDGYVGKRVAESFSSTTSQLAFDVVRGTPATCPNCGSRYHYLQSKIWPDGTVDCQNCGTSFVIQSQTGPDIDDREDSLE
jgi:predicted Zn finger-like uncharacterized protein